MAMVFFIIMTSVFFLMFGAVNFADWLDKRSIQRCAAQAQEIA